MTGACIRWQAFCGEVQLKPHVLGNKETYRTTPSQLSAWLYAQQMVKAEWLMLFLSLLAWLARSKVVYIVSENGSKIVWWFATEASLDVATYSCPLASLADLELFKGAD